MTTSYLWSLSAVLANNQWMVWVLFVILMGQFVL